ncbi:hypothetical protein ACKAV7_009733 [Fusarium commune]
MVRRNYTEDDVAEAILDITDRGLSENEASQKRGVPQATLSGRPSGQASRNEHIRAHQRISKTQEETLIRCVLRQESLGYALSHSQIRACVEAILQQQGDNKPLSKHWTTRFVKSHLQLSTKLGKRQEAARFDGFTPKAVNWYFDIRENEYGWIKPENTVNVDEGGIMVGFADWHYITSLNDWTDNHIALEWLKDVYLLQTEPRDAPDARRIILDGQGSLTSMAGEAFPDSKEVVIEMVVDEEVESVIEVGVRSEDESDNFMVVAKRCQCTRSGQEVKKPRR